MSLSLLSFLASAPAQSAAVVTVTNHVFVTNVVVVTITNYVVSTNLTMYPNALTSQQPGRALPDTSWLPPDDGFDWIQLDSGEWLKGRLKGLQDRKLDFDSEELNDLTFDWKDVRQVRCPRLHDILLVNGDQLSGPVSITPERVLVGGPSPQSYPRDQLQSLTPGGTKEWNYWSGKASIGLTLRAGNTKSVDYNAQTHLQRRTPSTRLSLDYIGNLSSVDGVESANNHRVNTEFDYWLSRRLYLVAPFIDYYKDPFQNLDYRITGAVGVGFDILDRPSFEWNITTGPGYQYTRFESSQPGEPSEKQALALVFGSRLDWDITSRISFILDYRGIYTSREAGETTHHGVAALSLEMTRRLDLDVSFIWDRVSHPKVDADGHRPLPDDFRLVVGLGLDF